MEKRQTLVQLDDHLLSLLDERTVRRGCSRSALIRDAIEAYLAIDADAAIDAAIVSGYERVPPREDPAVHRRAVTSIEEEPW
jgi:metal-responsive CopG/Arc/MetJ family transcriptional regulator